MSKSGAVLSDFDGPDWLESLDMESSLDVCRIGAGTITDCAYKADWLVGLT